MKDQAQAAIAKQLEAAIPQELAILNAMVEYFPLLANSSIPPSTYPVCFGGCASAGFWEGWIRKTAVTAKTAALNALVVGENVPVWAVNSPSDLNLPPYAYSPLVQICAGLGEANPFAGGAGCNHTVVQNITHEMTPADLSSPAVNAALLASLGGWIKQL